MTREEQDKLRNNFVATFQPGDGKMVLRHLEEFCFANRADFVPDARQSAYIDGRRSVVCEIKRILKGE